jgi:hypothetical protein
MSRLGPFKKHPELCYRVGVLAATLAAACTLLGLGYDPRVTVVTVAGAAIGGVQVGCRLTSPVIAPAIRSVVLVIVLVVVIALLVWGYPPAVALGVVLPIGGCAAEVSRRMAGQSYHIPRVVL